MLAALLTSEKIVVGINALNKSEMGRTRVRTYSNRQADVSFFVSLKREYLSGRLPDLVQNTGRERCLVLRQETAAVLLDDV